MKGIHIFLANGFEDIEALGTRDILIRGGVPVITVSITDDYIVESSHGLQVMADTSWAELEVMEPGTDASDIMIFPGGMPGSRNLAQQAELMEILKDHWARGGSVAAICAAPGLVVSQLPGLADRRFTCYNGFQDALTSQGAIFTPDGAVCDLGPDAAASVGHNTPACDSGVCASPAATVGGPLITGRGPGHVTDFALAILSHLRGPEAASAVRSGMLL